MAVILSHMPLHSLANVRKIEAMKGTEVQTLSEIQFSTNVLHTFIDILGRPLQSTRAFLQAFLAIPQDER